MAEAGRTQIGLTPRQSRARYRRIIRFGARFLVVMWWTEVFLPRIGLGRLARAGRDRRLRRYARQFHHLALHLGGLMIKVGQFLSTRLDVLPPEVTEELEGLQDQVPPEDLGAIIASAERELARPLESAYEWFDPRPLAAASLGQAHRARLTPTLAADVGFADVVVKVQRPGIETVVTVDLAALDRLAGWVSHVGFVSRRVDVKALVAEFATTSLQEIDYLHEAENAEEFTAAFHDDPRVATPTVVWERTAPRLLTLQDVSAVSISDVPAIRAAGIDPAQVADELARVSLEQLFLHGFFHADPHPGNLFVTPCDDGTWTLTVIDFGMMGRIPDSLQGDLRAMVIAIVARDAPGMVAAVQRLGMILPGADAAQLEEVMAGLFTRFAGMSVPEMAQVDPAELKDFADRFNDSLRAMPVQLPDNFLWLIRAISLVSGVCTTLNPDFNMWAAVEPFAARLTRAGGAAAARDLGAQVVTTATTLTRLPGRLDDVLIRAERGTLAFRVPETERRLWALTRAVDRITMALVFGAAMLSGVLLYPHRPDWAEVLMGGAVVPLVGLMLGMRRR